MKIDTKMKNKNADSHEDAVIEKKGDKWETNAFAKKYKEKLARKIK